ncbi:uncharacterized protein DDB_G0283357 [Scaptodrosophila lebanonensis]|uniref:Uncharacterized protein DDB_G0283357 n=1 Tax=Drosophila lebanonensis TaxID=7225 RepID=A0A6J2TNX6_DROLE|nr:uncharacterized protein DDB_G0283357 [Scaptodrosophila lebanonensis]
MLDVLIYLCRDIRHKTAKLNGRLAWSGSAWLGLLSTSEVSGISGASTGGATTGGGGGGGSNNNHIYVNPHSYDSSTGGSISGSTAIMLPMPLQLVPDNNNGAGLATSSSCALSRQHTSTTLSTLNTYLFPCGADSAGTIGGGTFNGSTSCDLDSNFSQMVAGSEAGSSTFSAGGGGGGGVGGVGLSTGLGGFINKRRIRKLFGVGNGGGSSAGDNFGVAPYASALRRRSSHLVQFHTAAFAKKKQQQQQEQMEQRIATVASANAAFLERREQQQQQQQQQQQPLQPVHMLQQPQPKKKKPPGPPAQMRQQASRTMDQDPLMNRPRKNTPASGKKKETTRDYEKYPLKQLFIIDICATCNGDGGGSGGGGSGGDTSNGSTQLQQDDKLLDSDAA